jgi:CHAD domain-containing protein
MKAAKEGDRADVVARPGPLRLVEEPPPEATAEKAKPVRLLKSDSVEDAAVCVFSAALDHFEANIPVFLSVRSAESVHQMRVALRRLRAAMGLFGKALAGERLEMARTRAKALGPVLGAARNCDVFAVMLQDGPGAALDGDRDFPTLMAALARRRAEAYRAARDAVDGDETESFLVDFRKTIAGRDWEPAPGAADEGSAVDFARVALTRLRKRALKKSRDLATRTPQERHQARIALKKARYGAEFFASLFDPEEAERFTSRLARIQDGLGAFTDMTMAQRLLDEIGTDDGATPQASGFVRGWFAHAAQDAVDHARKSEKRLKKLEPFWC